MINIGVRSLVLLFFLFNGHILISQELKNEEPLAQTYLEKSIYLKTSFISNNPIVVKNGEEIRSGYFLNKLPSIIEMNSETHQIFLKGNIQKKISYFTYLGGLLGGSALLIAGGIKQDEVLINLGPGVLMVGLGFGIIYNIKGDNNINKAIWSYNHSLLTR